MNIDKYTIKSQRVIQTMIAQARQQEHQALEPICLLDALLREGRDVVEYVATKAGAYMHQIEQSVAQQLERLPHVSGGEPYLSNQTNQVLTQS